MKNPIFLQKFIYDFSVRQKVPVKQGQNLPLASLKGLKGRLKGQCHEIFDFWFFHESVSPKPLSVPLGWFRIFSKIRGDIGSSRFATGHKSFNYLVWTPLGSIVNL